MIKPHRLSIWDRHRNSLLLLVLLAVVGICRLTVFFVVHSSDPTRGFSSDSGSYVNTAKAFLETGHFAVGPDLPEVPQVIRTPGYPFFLATIFFLFGERYVPVIVIQIVISLGTIMLTYLIASQLWTKNVALVSAFLLTLDLPSFVNSQKVLTDTLFTFFLSLAIFVSCYVMRESRSIAFWTFSYGLLLSLATLIRPIAYYAIFVAIIACIVTWKICLGMKWKKIATLTLALILPWGLLVGGWQLRNYFVIGSPEFSNVTGWNLLFCRGAGIIAQREGISFEEARQRLGFKDYRALYPETVDWTIAQRDRRWKQEGLRLIFHHPWLFLQSQVRGFLKMMLGTGHGTLLAYIRKTQNSTTQSARSSEPSVNIYMHKWILGTTGSLALFFFEEIYLVLFYIGIIFSVWQGVQIQKGTLSPFDKTEATRNIHLGIWLIIFYLVGVSVSVGPEAYSRFRIPIMPLLSVYAGHGVSRIVLRRL